MSTRRTFDFLNLRENFMMTWHAIHESCDVNDASARLKMLRHYPAWHEENADDGKKNLDFQ